VSGQPYFHFRLRGGGGIWGDFLISAFSFFFVFSFEWFGN